MMPSNILSLRRLIAVAGLLARLPLCGQDTLRPQHYLSIGHENDFLNVIGKRTDQYYTGGVFVRYGSYRKSGHGLLSTILLAPEKPERSFYSTGISFLMYSPTNLRLRSAQVGDYPYSGTLLLDLSRESIPDPRTLFRSELWLGVTGPLAQGEWAQTTLHRNMDFIIPRGWGNQLPNSPVLNYNLYYEKNLTSFGDRFHLNGLGYAQIGTMTDAVKAGLHIVYSSFGGDDFPGRLYARDERENSRRWKFFAELMPAVKFSAYNSLIEGGLFGHRDYYRIGAGDIHRLLFEGSGGFGLRSRGFSFSYREIFETKEFSTVRSHRYGSIFIGIRL